MILLNFIVLSVEQTIMRVAWEEVFWSGCEKDVTTSEF